MTEAWNLKGEMTLSCSCTVFCPCVLSLGEHPPTEDRCRTWAGTRIDQGRFDAVDLSGTEKSCFRGFGRNWNLSGRSAEIVKLDWGNQ